MKINSINMFNSNPINFGNESKKSNGMKNSAKALIFATALSGIAGCDALTEQITHNHFLDLPCDTFTKQELVPTPVPPQVIVIEKPGKNDTIYIPGDTIYMPGDTIVKNDTIVKKDTIYQKPDTIYQPGDTIIKNDTIYQPNDTIYLPGDTIVLPADTIVKHDTIIQKPDTIYIPGDTIVKNDTIYQPGDTIYLPGDTIVKRDTIVGPPVIKRDTVYLKGDTVFIKDKWKSPIPPKQEEILDNLGIESQGSGKFFISTAYYDRKNNELVNRQLDGQRSSRDGNILVYNVIKTKWDDDAEGVVLGKNETFEKQLVFLSEDGSELGMKILKPKVNVHVANGNKKSNWQVFSKGTLSTPGNWKEETAFIMNKSGGVIDLTNGFNLKAGKKPQTVTVTNPHQSEWDLINWSVVKGDAD